MRKILFDPDSMTEFLEAVQFYEESKKGLGVHYKQIIESATLRISESPFLYRIIHTPFEDTF